MFVTYGQIYVFIVCVAIGGLSGILFSLSALLKLWIKNQYFRTIPDIFVFAVLSAVYVFLSYTFGFPNLRAYMILGVFVGIIVYFKSFHILLANCLKKLYNIIRKKVLKVRYDRVKVKKINSCVHGGRGVANCDIDISNVVSNNFDVGAKEAH